MADITMCKGKDCPIKAKCHRHTAPESKGWQSWFVGTPGKYWGKKWVCDKFWEVV